MSPTRNPGRVAGFWFALLILLGPLRLIVIPQMLFVHDNAAATANNIAAHKLLFSFGILADLIGGVFLVLLVLAFYRLFQGVDQHLAVQVAIFGGVMPGVLLLLNAVTDLAALMVVRDADFLSVFDKPQRDALVMLFLRLHGQQITAAEILWGVWLFPLAILVYRSRFLPRFLGVWLILDGIGWVASCFIGIVSPQYQDLMFKLSQPAAFAEIALMLWLLIRGANPPVPVPAASSSAVA